MILAKYKCNIFLTRLQTRRCFGSQTSTNVYKWILCVKTWKVLEKSSLERKRVRATGKMQLILRVRNLIELRERHSPFALIFRDKFETGVSLNNYYGRLIAPEMTRPRKSHPWPKATHLIFTFFQFCTKTYYFFIPCWGIECACSGIHLRINFFFV